MEFGVLGPLEVVGPAGPIRLGGARQRRLLANLLVHANSVVSSEYLVDQLWPDPPDTARQQLHNAVAALRRGLAEAGESRIATEEVGYRIRLADDEFDMTKFHGDVAAAGEAEAAGALSDAATLLERALGHWRGPALDGLDGKALRTVAARLDEERIGARERLCAVKVALGRHESVLGELTGLLREQPLHESARATLMLALCRSGRPSDALDVYREGRRVVAAELGLDPSPRLRELHDRILRGDRDLLGAPPGAPAAGEFVPARPAFLPYGIRDFTGRADVIGQVLAEVEPVPADAPVIITIDGMGGIGKTALAVHLGHRLGSAFPDGQYFVDLCGFTADQEPVTAHSALDLLLRAGGVPAERIQPDLGGRAAQWRSHVAGKRILVLLDNAADDAQVRPLLPGTPGALVLVTSRRRLSGLDGAVPVSLGFLEPDEALELFRRISGREAGPDAADVVALCGRLPLAIRIAGSRLRHRREWSVAHLGSLLRDQRQRTRIFAAAERSVADVLEVSYRDLDDKAALALRLLGLHPGPDFDQPALAALMGCDPDEADEHLERLFTAHLVLQRTTGRHQLHDLVRDFALSALDRAEDAADQAAARRRLFDYYLHLAHVCCRPFARGFARIEPEVPAPDHLPEIDSETTAMRVLKTELPNFMAVTRYAIEHGWHDHAWRLPCTLQPFFTRVNYREDSLDLFHGALAAARATGSKQGESAALCNIALALRDRGQYDDVRDLLRASIALSSEIGDEPTVAYLYANLGIARIRAGDLPEAEETFTRAREIAVRLDDRQGYAVFTNNLGVAASRAGRLDEAVRRFSEAREIYRELAFPQGEAIADVNLGEARMLVGAYAEAVELLERAQDTSRTISFQLCEGMALSFLATTYRLLGEPERAAGYAEEALGLARRANLGEVECDALNATGEIALARGDADAAEPAFEAAAARAGELHLPLVAGRASEGLAHVYRARGDLARAVAHWEQALRSYPEGIADAANARRHLAAPADDGVTCRRCLGSGSPPRSSGPPPNG